MSEDMFDPRPERDPRQTKIPAQVSAPTKLNSAKRIADTFDVPIIKGVNERNSNRNLKLSTDPTGYRSNPQITRAWAGPMLARCTNKKEGEAKLGDEGFERPGGAPVPGETCPA